MWQKCCRANEEEGGDAVEPDLVKQVVEPEPILRQTKKVEVLEPVNEEMVEEPVKEAPATPRPEPVKGEPPALEQLVTEVECTISRMAGSAWGMTFEPAGRFLLIDAIRSGAVSKYNEGVSEKAQLRTGDYIIAVTGLNLDDGSTSIRCFAADMLALFKDANLLALTVKVGRPEQMYHQIVKREDGQSWGLTLDKSKKVAQVDRVRDDGAVWVYNKEREPEAQLQPGDLIIGCNGSGKFDNSNVIMAILKDKTVKSLELQSVRVGKLAQ